MQPHGVLQRHAHTRPIEHGETSARYLADLDGNGIEFYVDGTDDWRDSSVQEPMSAPLAAIERAPACRSMRIWWRIETTMQRA
jgi:catechol-2,3-dioxygenase